MSCTGWWILNIMVRNKVEGKRERRKGEGKRRRRKNKTDLLNKLLHKLMLLIT